MMDEEILFERKRMETVFAKGTGNLLGWQDAIFPMKGISRIPARNAAKVS